MFLRLTYLSIILWGLYKLDNKNSATRDLTSAKLNKEYLIKDILTTDSEMKNFLFTLGCYEGQLITVLSLVSNNYIVSLHDARYSIDENLAKVIKI